MRVRRWAVVLLLATVSPLLGSVVAPTAASADPACVTAWWVMEDGSREYIVGPETGCVETGWSELTGAGTEQSRDEIPCDREGAGFEVTGAAPV